MAYAVPSNRLRPYVLPFVGVVHAGATVNAVAQEYAPVGDEWMMLDPLGKILLLSVSGLFLCCSFYAPGYLRFRNERSNRNFVACLLILVAMMSLVAYAQHLGVLWVAVEATTLAAAPLIHFRYTPKAIEATWKYLIVCSVGIALALLGLYFLAYSTLTAGDAPKLVLSDLVRSAHNFSAPWLRAAFLTLLVGYGTKMGLAPMHTWKPDAYGEAPGLVGAMLAGGLTSCAFVAILRVSMILVAAGQAAMVSRAWIILGVSSMALAAAFLARQRDFKRMLAYSSVEQMGILAIGAGLGGLGLFGALLHMLNNALAKGVMFLSSGNIHRAYDSKSSADVRGAMSRVPLSGGLFLVGFFAVAGSPPFGPFVSVITILQAAMTQYRYGIAAAYLLLLFLVFAGMGKTVVAVVMGGADDSPSKRDYRDNAGTVVPIVVLLTFVLVLGVHLPETLRTILYQAVDYVQVMP
ncbi:MAG: hydrogenase [Candidatus Hydrogenedentes bacterium]|nr:hydrogenase [Candidatus Hydrogenedentota bacterium]